MALSIPESYLHTSYTFECEFLRKCRHHCNNTVATLKNKSLCFARQNSSLFFVTALISCVLPLRNKGAFPYLNEFIVSVKIWIIEPQRNPIWILRCEESQLRRLFCDQNGGSDIIKKWPQYSVSAFASNQGVYLQLFPFNNLIWRRRVAGGLAKHCEATWE